MVEKVVEMMGYFGGKWWRRWWRRWCCGCCCCWNGRGDGGKGGGEVGGGGDGERWPAKGGHGGMVGCCRSLLAVGGKKEEEKMKEREKEVGCIYKRIWRYYKFAIGLPLHQRDLRLPERWPRLGKNELAAEIRVASRRKTRDCVLTEKTKVVMTWSELT